LFHPGVAKEAFRRVGLVPLIWFWAVGRQSGSNQFWGYFRVAGDPPTTPYGFGSFHACLCPGGLTISKSAPTWWLHFLTSSREIRGAACPLGTDAQRIISSKPGSFQTKSRLMFSMPVFFKPIQVSAGMNTSLVLFVFNQLSKQFPHALSSFIESALPGSCNPVDAAQAFSRSLFAGTQIATFFEAVKNRVHRSGTDLVSMAGSSSLMPAPKIFALSA
jgi:hypothetical protein